MHAYVILTRFVLRSLSCTGWGVNALCASSLRASSKPWLTGPSLHRTPRSGTDCTPLCPARGHRCSFLQEAQKQTRGLGGTWEISQEQRTRVREAEQRDSNQPPDPAWSWWSNHSQLPHQMIQDPLCPVLLDSAVLYLRPRRPISILVVRESYSMRRCDLLQSCTRVLFVMLSNDTSLDHQDHQNHNGCLYIKPTPARN